MCWNPANLLVDGSCEDNRNVTSDTSAGWGFCVIDGDNGIGKGQGNLIYEESGKVETNSKLKFSRGGCWIK